MVVFTGYGGIEKIRCYTFLHVCRYNATYFVMDNSIRDMPFHNQNLPFHEI